MKDGVNFAGVLGITLVLLAYGIALVRPPGERWRIAAWSMTVGGMAMFLISLLHD